MRIELENHGPDEATLHVLPTLWFRNTWSCDPGAQRPRIERDGSSLVVADHRLAGYRLDGAPGPDGSAPEALFCENETNAPRVFGSEATTPYPKDGINDHVISGAATVNPDGFGTKGALRYVVTRGGRWEGRAAAAAPPAGTQGRREGDLGRRGVRQGPRRTRGRRRRVLRGARAGRHRRGAHADPAPGLRRARLEQADVPLQRPPLARRRPGRATAAGGASPRPQQQLAAPRLVRRARDAGPVGVPVVRGLGPWLPLRPLGAPRSCVREVPADRAAARVVPAPERRASGLRVELRRREPAGACHGCDAGVPHRRRPRSRVPRADLPEAPDQLHVVAQPRGRRRQQRLQRRLPRARQHQPDRPLQPPGRRDARAGGRHGVDGLLRAHDARDRDRARAGERRLPGHGDQVPRAVRPRHASARAAGPLRPRTTASSTTAWSIRRASRPRSRCRRSRA